MRTGANEGKRPRVVVVGGGFGGLAAARELRRADVDVVLVDRKNHHVFQPLLYQVATGELTPASIAAPLRALLSKQRNCSVLLGEVEAVDLDAREIAFAERKLSYDALVVACGARHGYFGHDEWERVAPGLKTIEDATEMRRRLFLAFEAAERCEDPEVEREFLTFVIVGAGPTGVELAGALSETAHYALEHDFRSIDPSHARILLVEAGGRVLSMYPDDLSRRAVEKLDALHVEVLVDTKVVEVADDHVVVEGKEGKERVRTRTVLWAAGAVAAPIGRKLVGDRTDLVDRSGRVLVEEDCSLAGHPEVFVVGDPRELPPSGRRTVARRRARRAPAGTPRRAPGPARPRRSSARALPLRGPRSDGGGRTLVRGGDDRTLAFRGRARVVRVALRPPHADHALPQSRPGPPAVGLDLLHARTERRA
ncbi:MAG: NAD(P)/FAD-dependent oxidoreductase [Planctomycetota bacterium]